MKKVIATALALSIAAGITSCQNVADGSAELQKLTPDTTLPNMNADVSDVSAASLSGFCMEFQRTLAKNSDDSTNTLTSPLSAYIALAMLKEGANGTTLSQMSEVMGDVSGEDMLALILHLTSLENTTLNIADSIWIDNKFEPKQEYIDTLAAHYLAEGFKAELKYAETDVNLWIEEHTNGLIKDILGETALDASVMALVNTVYMNAKWANAFAAELTRERDFMNSDGSISRTDFMFKKANFRVIESENYLGVVLPYSDGSLSFIALMPQDIGQSMSDLLDSVAVNGGWGELCRLAVSEEVKLYLPKFEHEASLSLVGTLREMGLADAFNKNAANFEKIADEIYLDGVMQTAVLKLDEAGTEAAAATVATLAPTSARPPEVEPRTIEFDRPFAFAVVDAMSGAVLFAGEHNTSE